MRGYSVGRIEEIDELSDGRCPWRPVRHHFGITSFGINAWTGRAAGDRIINEHAEDDGDGEEELYVVLQGRAAFEIDGERVEAGAGTFVFVPPRVRRTAFAEEPGTTILAVGGAPGKAYEPGGWELWAPYRAAYEAGRYEEVIGPMRELADEHPEYPALVYNVACLESLMGRKEEALAHLREALGRSNRLRDLARTDSDLDAIRGEPAFEELVGA
jgi:tetratricopeptide (TPR) repeat protein